MAFKSLGMLAVQAVEAKIARSGELPPEKAVLTDEPGEQLEGGKKGGKSAKNGKPASKRRKK
jgi:hypothetical protein